MFYSTSLKHAHRGGMIELSFLWHIACGLIITKLTVQGRQSTEEATTTGGFNRECFSLFSEITYVHSSLITNPEVIY
jgi:hypothetical protein